LELETCGYHKTATELAKHKSD